MPDNLTPEQEAVATAQTALTAATGAAISAGTDEQKAAIVTAQRALEDAQGKLPKPAEDDPLKVDIHEAIAKARKDEKDKMYGKVNKLTEDITAKDARTKELETQVASLVKAADDAKAAAEGNKEGDNKKEEKPADIDMTQIEDLVNKQVKALEDTVFTPAMDALKKENADLKAVNDAATLESHRLQLISDNKGSIIEELVKGSTTEELDTNLVLAKQTFAKYNIQAVDDANAEGNNLPPKPNLNGQDQSSPITIDPNMSDKEYAAKREDLLKQAAASVAKQYNPQS